MRFALAWVFLTACGASSGTLDCPVAQATCNGTCVDLTNNPDHCGSCTKACTVDQVCGNSVCSSSCPSDQMDCSGTCADLTHDPNNCGACGKVCDSSDTCVASECQIPCDPTKLNAAVTDGYGNQWDGAERTASTFATAQTACSAFGARLPTATEVLRGSSVSTAAAALWTAVPADTANQVTAKLSDGSTNTPSITSSVAYRCVCGATVPKSFTGKHCNGDPGTECYTAGDLNFDAKDRAQLRHSSALWECANDRAHLAEASTLIEGIKAGLPGTNTEVATADSAAFQATISVQWQASTFEASNGNIGAPMFTAAKTFRCAAPKAVLAPNPNNISNQFVAPNLPQKSETADSVAATWSTAHDTCVVRGGHLPRAGELAELIEQGLPNGSGTKLWTSDEVGYNSQTDAFYAETLSWTGTDQRFSFNYMATADGLPKQASAAYRCIYYPLDLAYTAPTTCNGGCYLVSLDGTPAPTMWFDSTERAAATYAAATATCTAVGARLASERDLTEAARSGLPNGSGSFVLTSDFSNFGGPSVMVVKWTGTDAMFSDQYPTYVGPVSSSLQARPYRCMWTNEQR